MTWIRRNLKIVLPVTAVVLAGVLFLALGVFGVHTLFIDDTVDEAGPVFDSGVAVAAAPVEPTPTEPDEPEPVITETPAPQIAELV